MGVKIDIITLFPGMFVGPFSESILKRGQDKKIIEVVIHDLRKWSVDKRGTVDDRPYGGGPGMIMMVEPIKRAVDELRSKRSKVILMDPSGKPFNQPMAKELSTETHLILICGHYEGVDQRIKEYLTDETISVGDYILTGGELPAMVVVDAVSRLIPGVLGKDESSEVESFSGDMLEYPQYTRPVDFEGWKVPEVLLSGNHAKIDGWRKSEAHKITQKTRPDLISKHKKL